MRDRLVHDRFRNGKILYIELSLIKDSEPVSVFIVWKPGTSLQGRTSGGYTCARQQYVADLEVKA